MIKLDNKGPRFRGNGAETRHLVLFGYELTSAMQEHLPNTLHLTLEALMKHLMTFYMTFGCVPFGKEVASSSAKNVCLLYSGLSKRAGDPRFWKIKPKMHLFIELAEYQVLEVGDPSKFWTYLDEDFMGVISKYAAARGGGRRASTIPTSVMDKYRAMGI